MITGLLALGVATAAAQTPVDADLATLAARETAAWRLIASLQSPFCPGLTLESCPSWYADSLRTVIRERMARGEPAERIRAELARDFGQRVLGEPTWEGIDVTAWIGPAVLILLGAAGLTVAIRRERISGAVPARGRPEYVPPMPDLSPAERARLEAALARELTESERGR